MKKHVRLIGSAALLLVLLWRVHWRQVGEAFARLEVGLWLAAVGIYLGCQLLSTVRWQILSRAIGFSASWMRYVNVYFVGMFFNLALPTSIGGDAVRAWYQAKFPHEHPHVGPRTSAAVVVFADRLFGVILLIVLACAAAVLCPVRLPSWMIGCVVAAGVAPFVGLAALVLVRRLLAHRRTELVPFPSQTEQVPFYDHHSASSNGSIVSRITRVLQRVLDAIWTYRAHPGAIGIALGLSAIVQVGNALVAWVIAVGLGFDVSPAYFCVVVPLVTLLTLVPISVNGMGLREAGFVVLLAPVGVGAPEAVTLSLLIFAVVALVSLPGIVGLRTADSRGNPQCEELAHDHVVSRHPDQGREGQSRAVA